MKIISRFSSFRLTACFGFTTLITISLGQSLPAGSQPSPTSIFLLAGGVFTGLGGFGATEGLGGRNVGITAGINHAFLTRGPYQVKAEIRGTYPVYRGHVDGQADLLGGLRLEKSFRRWPRLIVYGDALGGRGQMWYVDGGYVTPSYIYLTSSSAVYGGGGGFEIAYKQHWAFVGEAQLQRWKTPVTREGKTLAKTGSGGLVYRF